ncbi:hypothetical protein FH608_009990 [Nonomuraea phyllanthi]|uniref:DUF5941 domain-containing protein n=1 Tax=Nonomuraea phyllanthi TaxID=2219224 RepID=A0A5C4WQG3_9ACTN|nr:DUF5941 domain-containing protein [Nonomuraea phyllanthi]KAB8195825.1 hypothetical protein FH608_009990 [Nonomuraea phyllanthi]QFY07280.1 hypothetical protein GBF35_11785 [Nonomuraea phyllanthi]
MITQPQAMATPTPDPDEERRRIQTARLLAYRDDGPLTHALAGKLGRGLPPVPATLVALLAVVAFVVTGALTPGPAMLLPVATTVLLVLPTAPRDHLGRFDWLTPPLLRATELLAIVAIGLAAGAPKWLLFVLVYVVGYHTYDTVYRTRQSIWPPAWVFHAGLGWELRLLIIGVGAALDRLTPVLAVLTAYLFVLFAVESVTSWVRLDKASAQASADSEQDLEASPEEQLEQATGEADQN